MARGKLDGTLKFAIGGLLVVLAYVIVDGIEDHIAAVGDRAPSFSIVSDNGMQISPRNFGGKLLVVNFWATWCPPCVQEMPSLNEFSKSMASSGVVVLGISVDRNEKLYRNMLKKFQVSFPTARDPGENISAGYGTHQFPESYIINRDGKVVGKFAGLPRLPGQDDVLRSWMDPEIVKYVRSLL